MIPDKLRISLILVLIIYFILILLLLKKREISLKYTLLWLFAGLCMGILVIWPESLTIIISIIGIQGSMNGLFILAIAFVIAILMSITSIVSKQSEKIRSLTQTIAILEKKIREQEERLKDKNEQWMKTGSWRGGFPFCYIVVDKVRTQINLKRFELIFEFMNDFWDYCI